jgi:hypothetical protein
MMRLAWEILADSAATAKTAKMHRFMSRSSSEPSCAGMAIAPIANIATDGGGGNF